MQTNKRNYALAIPFVILFFVACTGDNGTTNTAANPDVSASDLGSQLIAKKSFTIDPASDAASYWSSTTTLSAETASISPEAVIPAQNTESGSVAAPTKSDVKAVDVKASTVSFDGKNVIFTPSSGEASAGTYVAIPPDQVMTTVGKKDVYWKVSISGSSIIMNLRDKTLTSSPTSTTPTSTTPSNAP